MNANKNRKKKKNKNTFNQPADNFNENNENTDNNLRENLENIDRNESRLDKKEDEEVECITENKKFDGTSNREDVTQQTEKVENIANTEDAKKENQTPEIYSFQESSEKEIEKSEIEKPEDNTPSKKNSFDEKSSQKNLIENESENLENSKNLNGEHKSKKSESDKISSDSKQNPNSIQEFFSSTRQDNAKRIQSQIVNIQTNALCYTNSLIKLSKNFNLMKRKLNSISNSIFNSLFSLFEYSFRSNFQNTNLFIFSTQSLLILIGEILNKRLKTFSESEKQNLKYSNLLEIIQTEMQESTKDIEGAFLNNLAIFTGNLLLDRASTISTTLIENKIGQSFLKIFLELITKDESLKANTDIQKKQFEEILMDLIKRSVEATLNKELSGGKSQPKLKIEFITIVNELKRETLIKTNKDTKISFDDYYNHILNSSIKNEFNCSNFELEELKICAEAFYTFSQVRLDEIILDANLFVKNYSSVVYKSKLFLEQSIDRCIKFSNKIKRIYIKIADQSSSLGLEKISQCSYLTGRNILKKCAIGLKSAKRSVINFKYWLGDSYLKITNYKPVFMMTNIMLDIFNYSGEVPLFMFEIVVEKSQYGIKAFKDLKKKIFEKISRIKGTISSALSQFGKLKNFVYLKEDKSDERFVIVFNRSLFDFCPGLFFKIYEIFKNLLIKSYKGVVDNVPLVNRFKRLLGVSEKHKSNKIKLPGKCSSSEIEIVKIS